MAYEIFLLQELEERIATKSGIYKREIEINFPSLQNDLEIFRHYINDELLYEYSTAIFNHIKYLDNQETYRTLSLTAHQFQTHSLENGRIQFLRHFHFHYLQHSFVEFNIESYDKGFAADVWELFLQYYHLYHQFAVNILEDFNAGLLGVHPSLITEEVQRPKTIKLRDFKSFIHHLEFPFPNSIPTFNFVYMLQENMVFLRKEVLDNLLNLDKDKRKPYLNMLKYDCEVKLKLACTTKEDLQVWLDFYHIASEEEIRYNTTDNVINRILRRNTPTQEEEAVKGFNKNTVIIQRLFYNYYYGYYINKAIIFLNNQIEELCPYIQHHVYDNQLTTHEYIPPFLPPPHLKLKTNLSVPQLALIFKLLMDLDPPVFDIDSNRELYTFMEANFLTKGKGDIGPTIAKLNNLNSFVDKSTTLFWRPILKKMSEMLRDL